MRTVALLLLVILCTGCAGTNAIKVSSVPDASKIYVNGEYFGETPKTVPSKWWCFIGCGGDTIHFRLEKEGYRLFEKNIPWSELNWRYYQGQFTAGSEFGGGHTYPYTFHLEVQQK